MGGAGALARRSSRCCSRAVFSQFRALGASANRAAARQMSRGITLFECNFSNLLSYIFR